MWAGFTGVRGGQRVTTREFDNFSYCRHSATIATPYRRESSACHGKKKQQSTSNGGDGRRDGNVTATEMNGTTAKRLQRDGDNDATVTTGSGSMATAQRRQRQRRRQRRRR
jgi:hypothetical protein